MPDKPSKLDTAKAIEAIRDARPPATDRFTYLTIIEANLCPEVLPTLNEVLQDAELTQEIGWDLVYNLVNLPGSEKCLETVARLGNPREVILKVLETLELMADEEEEEEEEEEDQDEQTDNDEPQQKLVVSRTHKFITLVGMLAILHKRIKTKYPSRFLAQTLHTVFSTYKPASHEMTAAIVNLVHSLSGRRRPPLPTRQSSVNVANPDQDGDSSKNAPDPEADDKEGKEDPTEAELQRKLLLSFVICVLEAYVNGNDMAWAARLLEFYNPTRVVPGRRTLMAAFRENRELQARDSMVGKLVSLIADLRLEKCSKDFIHQVCEGPVHTQPLTEPNDLTTPDHISLSTGGCICLIAYWVFAATVFNATTHPCPEMYIFPEHLTLLDKFLRQDAHSQINNSPGTADALVTVGMWLHRNNLIASDPSSPLTNPTKTSPEDPTSDYMRYIHLTTLVALYHPQLQARNAASTLAALVLHADPSDEDRLRIFYDLLENCTFAVLKARAVAWLREAIIAASQHHKEKNAFAGPHALETLQYVVFPSLGEVLLEDLDEAMEFLAANAPFLLQAVNFALFLWGSKPGLPSVVSEAGAQEQGQDNKWAHVLPDNMHATVRERWFEPLKKILAKIEQEVVLSEDELGPFGGDIVVLRERLARLEGTEWFKAEGS